jgi:PKHD-type hydroxylase|tara:strand:- start:3365 stop:3949 length:585 start_codon:yes stop_codon:yes gene_type:complete
MQHLLTPHSKGIEPFAWWDDGFTDEQLDWLQQKAREATQEAQVGGGNGGEVNDKVRRSELNWLHKDPECAWVFEQLAHVAASLNAAHFGFDLTGFGEALQLTNYHEARQGNYIWHQDFGAANVSRKLSMVLQLSDPNDYEGGELQILTSGQPTGMQKKRGLITVFPAWTLHQVTPVVRGTRQTLVTWVSGPAFK